MQQNATKIAKKTQRNYECQKCDYITSNLSDYKKHLQTIKHNATKCNAKKHNLPLTCICGVVCNNRTTLWRHKKKCDILNETDDKELILLLIKQNSLLIDKNTELVEQIATSSSSSSSFSGQTITNSNLNNNNNNNNNTFNLQFFLNETCKDAMNITDFVSSVKVSLEDLENTGRHGYIQGISNIIINKLNKLERHLRPLHCSDYKREVLYIKDDNNEWTKDGSAKPILTKAIKTIANENMKQINKWVENYPDCVHADSKKNKLYLNIVSNSMNGLTKEEGDKNITKIISNIVKEVIIEKKDKDNC